VFAPFETAFAGGIGKKGKGKENLGYGEGLIVNVPFPESVVEQVVQDVSQNGVIRGTKEYNKDQYVSGAVAEESPKVFTAWTKAGKVLYKVRTEALDPRNFKDSGDIGTLEVRYVLLPQGEKNTVVRIDALYQEDFRRVIHQSNGSVESAEYGDIREHLDQIEVMKKQDAEAQLERQQMLAKKRGQAPSGDSSSSVPAGASSAESATRNIAQASESGSSAGLQNAPTPVVHEGTNGTPAAQDPDLQTLEQRVQALRKQVSRIVKSPGAPLKSAPFHTANTLQLLGTGTEVLIVIDTPYWYGVETHEGQHGWIMRDELDQQP
jgi:polyhydroxyalkanoate synthesis regulator phasin